MVTNKYEKTFWIPSVYGKSVGIPSYELYAIVESRALGDSYELLAWKMEVRGVGLHHPAYNLVLKEDCTKYDFFVDSSERGNIPYFKFNSKSSNFVYLCDNTKDLLRILFEGHII